MGNPTSSAHCFESRDAAGASPGVTVPAGEWEALRNWKAEQQELRRLLQDLAAEQERLRREVGCLTEKLSGCETTIVSLRQQNQRLREQVYELDVHLKALYAFARGEEPFTEADLREMETNGITLDQIIKELEQPERKAHA